MKSKHLWYSLVITIFLLGLTSGLSLAAPPAQGPRPTPEREIEPASLPLPELQGLSLEALTKIDPLVVEELTIGGQTDFFIWMREKADLSPANQLTTKAEKGRFVFETLRDIAQRSQASVQIELDRQGINYQSFYIANKLLVRGGNTTMLATLATRSDIARITANHSYQLPEPIIQPAASAGPLAIEPNLIFVNADDVWAMGINGSGTVLAGNDTGLDWDHLALINQYRGWNGSSVDHNYNWWDATGTYPSVPGDGHGHGSHTRGTMVGDDGGANQIGMAPGARTIHCKNLTDSGAGWDATITECFQWDLAPWDLNGANPRPDLAPDAINNSWEFSGGGLSQFEDEIAALQAAGILVEFSAGNDGSYCNSLGSPGDYSQVLTTGSVNHAGGALPGTITWFSSRGPSNLYPNDTIPDIMAPGEDIRSSLPGNSYASWSGTSMAGPHVTGLIGLMWSANPDLRGEVEQTIQFIAETAIPLTGQPGSNCGGNYTTGPNNDWGYGTIDALGAVQRALRYGGTGMLNGTVSDAVTQAPIANARLQATLSPTQTWQANSDAQGDFSLQVISGTYTIDGTRYGYLPGQMTNIAVLSGTTTTLNINLSPAATRVVSGHITDADTGWPLYAQIDIDGYPGDSIWSDAVTGFYSITLAEGAPYTFNVTATNYLAESRSVGPLTGNQAEDFGLQPDFNQGCPPGYMELPLFADDFEKGYLGPTWQTFTTNRGRVRVDSLYPHQGNYSALLDTAGGYSIAGFSGIFFI